MSKQVKKEISIRNSTADFLVFVRQNGEQGIEAICELFQKKRTTILEHLQNIFNDKELNKDSVCRKKLSGKPILKKPPPLYELTFTHNHFPTWLLAATLSSRKS
jgi:hypothetical protein